MLTESKSFSSGDHVLCYHGPKLYEAKILGLRSLEGRDQFFVHYQGWKNKWDEWVDADRLVTYGQEGLALQKHLQAAHPTEQHSASDVTSDSAYEATPAVSVNFTFDKSFRRLAYQDWSLVAKGSKIVAAPVTFTAAHLILEYASAKVTPESRHFADSLIGFLNINIGKQLLYTKERGLHQSLDHSAGYCRLYSPAILVRFFARINTWLSMYTLRDDYVGMLGEFEQLNQFLCKYLQSVSVDDLYLEHDSIQTLQ